MMALSHCSNSVQMTETKCTLSKVQYGGVLGKRKQKCLKFSFEFIQTFGFLQGNEFLNKICLN